MNNQGSYANLDYNTFNNIDLCIAEVIDSKSDLTYQYKPNTGDDIGNYYNLFSVTAKLDGQVNRPVITAKPSNTNFKKIPIIGEIILVFRIKSSVATSDTYLQNQWYYLSTVDIASSMNHNSLTGYTNKTETEQQVGVKFSEQTVSPLQPYEGDILVEGRFGNSIRFGSTILNSDSNFYKLLQRDQISGNSDGSPIIILSNGRENKQAKEFVLEDIQKDKSSLYLTSDQRINNLTLTNTLRIGKKSADYIGSQFIGTADRIILSAKNDIVALDAKEGIEINSKLIKFGVKQEKEPLLHSTAVIKLLQIIIRTLQTGFVDSSGVICTALNTEIKNSSKINNLFKEAKNKYILVDTYKK